MTDADPKAWIGRTESAHDNMDAGHAARVATTLDMAPPAAGAPLPLLWHWAFFIPAPAYETLGEDGHPQRGGFLPPADNRNRMWAGGQLQFHRPLRVGVAGERRSTITDVTEKQGRSGSLLFVTVAHAYVQQGETCIEEQQNIVYREPAPPVLTGREAAPQAEWAQTVRPDPVMLFRYSAVTFNGHRIHYDAPYVREQEGYPNLVVHGPLIATLMLRAFMQANPEREVRSMSYRGLRPLIAPHAFRVAGRLEAADSALLWAEQEGTLAHRAEIRCTESDHA